MNRHLDTIMHGDCIRVMADLDADSVDFVLTDPPYLVSYRDRSGRSIANDDNDEWLLPAFRQIHRVMKESTLCVSFYGWHRADVFMTAWRAAGLWPVGHIVFRKPYASARRLLLYQHEQAYLLCKGPTPRTSEPISDVIDFPYSGNALHPTQKPIEALEPLIHAFLSSRRCRIGPILRCRLHAPRSAELGPAIRGHRTRPGAPPNRLSPAQKSYRGYPCPRGSRVNRSGLAVIIPAEPKPDFSRLNAHTRVAHPQTAIVLFCSSALQSWPS